MAYQKWIGIYIIINNVNGKKYIGASNNVLRRFMEHKSPKTVQTFKSPLYQAFRKYGLSKFDFIFLDLVKCESLLPETEKYWIKKLKPEYNMNEGGLGNVGLRMTKDVKKILSEKSKAQWERMTEEEKAHRVKNNLVGGREKGRVLSDETKEKLRRANVGKKQSPETIAKRAKALKEKGRALGFCTKVVVAYKDGKLFKKFPSVKAAAEYIGNHPSCITHVLKGNRKTTGGFTWKYLTTKNV